MGKIKVRSLIVAMLLMTNASAVTLRDAIEKTINTNPGIIAEHKNQDAFKKYVDEEQGDYLPTIDLETYYESSHEYNKPDNATKNDAHKNGWNAQLELEQILYDGGLTPSEISEYQYKYNANRFRSNLAIEGIVFETASTYLDVVQYEELMDLSTNIIKLHNKNLLTAKEKEAISGEKLETYQVSAKIHLTGERLLEQEDLRFQAKHNFKKFAGVDAGLVCRPQVHENLLPTSLEKALKIGVRRNYSILEQVEKIKEQRENLNQANAKFLPTLLFQLQAEWDDDLDLAENGRQDEYRARLFMRWNLLEGGKHKSASERETLFLQESKKTLNKITDEVVSQVTNSYNTYSTFKKRVDMLELYVLDNENILNVYIEEFDAGTRTFIDILNAEAELYNSKTSLIGKEFEMYKSYYALLTSLSMLTDTVLFEESQICKQKTYEAILDVDKNFGNNKGTDADIDVELEGLFEGDEGTSSNIKEEEVPLTDSIDDSIIELEENTNTSNLIQDNKLLEEVRNERLVDDVVFTSSSKMKEFLNTQPKYYTLNITTENGLNEADYVLKKYEMIDQGYTFKYGKGEGKAKVLYGTYSTYKEAKEALSNLNIAVVKRHSPYIDSVNKHQKLYKKYN